MTYHFISGLPRSGSTLLASLLSQNPMFTASIMTPVGALVTQALQTMSSTEAASFLSDGRKAAILRGIFDGYYSSPGGVEVVFDNNRRWTANVSLLARLFPDCKIICCVRSPSAIVDSFERLFQKNPLSLSVIHEGKANLTVYGRVHEIMQPNGVLGYAMEATRTASCGPHKDRLVWIEYDDLCRYPKDIMAELHETLGLMTWDYHFDNITPIPGTERFDEDVSTPGLHSLKPSVVYEPRQSILPPDLFDSLPPAFWRVKEASTTTG